MTSMHDAAVQRLADLENLHARYRALAVSFVSRGGYPPDSSVARSREATYALATAAAARVKALIDTEREIQLALDKFRGR